MPRRTNEEVAEILNELYSSKFAGKTGQRFCIRDKHLRELFPVSRIEESRFNGLQLAAKEQGLYLFQFIKANEEQVFAVIRLKTINRWRTVPTKMMGNYKP